MFHSLAVAAVAAVAGASESGQCGVESMDTRICNAAQHRFHSSLSVRVAGEFAEYSYYIDCNFNGTGDPFVIRSLNSSNPLSESLVNKFKNASEGIRLLFNYDIWNQECTALSESECKSATAHSPCVWIANSFNPGGKCVVTDRTCVENPDEDSCLENNACRWIPHDDPREVSYVPCRFIGTHDEVCDAYAQKDFCTNNPHCKWDSAVSKCVFNGCHHLSNVDQTCACTKGSADPKDAVSMCRYGHKCRIKSEAVSRGPYLVISGECEETITLAPVEDTCHEFWINSCHEDATDGTNLWRPLYDKWSTSVSNVSSNKEEICCEHTCAAWEKLSSENSCGNMLVRRDKTCGSEGCSHAKCCLPTCAAFECDANKPETLQDGSVLKPNAEKIACEGEEGKEECTFIKCCEVTCKAKIGICDTLGIGFRKERLRPNATELWCSKNGITEIQIDIAITADKCDHHYCCEPEFTTCKEAKEAGFSKCGSPGFEDWVDKSEDVPCGPTNDYKCGIPTHCCTRTCLHFLNHLDRRCDANFVNSNPNHVCDSTCSTGVCCVETCKNFNCTNGSVSISYPETKLCGASGSSCDESTCCIPTCLTKKLAQPDYCPTGKVFRDDLSNLVCIDGNCDNEDFCCQETCLHYTTTQGCTDHYNPKQQNQGRVCSTLFPCNRDNCCEPTCNHFLNPLNKCETKDDNGNLTGFSAIPNIGDKVCSGLECTHGECCHRTCSQYLSAYGGCSKGKAVDTSLSDFTCNGGCSEKQCCLETCESWHGCEANSGLHPDFRNHTCKSFSEGRCDQAKCCVANCSPFDGCDSGYIKKLDSAQIRCVGSTGTLADCTNSQCCRPTCAAHTCGSSLIRKTDASDIICDGGVCTDSKCCDTTCKSWTSEPENGYIQGACKALSVLVENPATIRCDVTGSISNPNLCYNKCCRETCASFLASTNGGSMGGQCEASDPTDGSYPLSVARNRDLLCDNSPSGSCTTDYCCEYTCAKFVVASCSYRGFTYRPETAGLGCSRNPRPEALINETYSQEVQVQGELILKHLYPCDRVFCCAVECKAVPECPVHETRRTGPEFEECKSLTSCNLHKCCQCGTGSSCHADPNGGEATRRCKLDVYGGSKKCVGLDQCAPASSQLNTVPFACLCHTKEELAAHETNPTQNALTDSCTEYMSQACIVGNPRGDRCVPKCAEGGNKDACVCGSSMCDPHSYCQNGQCHKCWGLDEDECDAKSAFCWWGASKNEVGCLAIRLTVGQALVGTTGSSSGGISALAAAGIAVGALALLVAGIFAAKFMGSKRSSEEEMLEGVNYERSMHIRN